MKAKKPFFQLRPSYEIVLCKQKLNRDQEIIISSEFDLESRITDLYQSIGIKISHNEKHKGSQINLKLKDLKKVGINISDPSAEFLIKEYPSRNCVLTVILPDCQGGFGFLGFSKDNSILSKFTRYNTGIKRRDKFIESVSKKYI